VVGHHVRVGEMTGPAHGVLRGVRGAVLAVCAVAVAEVAHAGTDGCSSLVGLLLALGLCWPAAVAVLGRQRRLGALLGWLAATQIGLHVLLESRCQEVVSGHQPLLAHLSVPPSGRVLLAHGLAVAVSAVLLGRADAGLWTVDALRRAVWLVMLPMLVVVVWPARRVRRVCLRVLPARNVWEGPRPSRRGPPALCAP
jgi:hypothetical protein